MEHQSVDEILRAVFHSARTFARCRTKLTDLDPKLHFSSPSRQSLFFPVFRLSAELDDFACGDKLIHDSNTFVSRFVR